MAKNTPSMAKNQMRRCLHSIVDPHPTRKEVSLLWAHFESKCAYCGLALERTARNGHVDHLIAHSAGGINSIYNHVLSCDRCNGDEKREEHWESFLARKAIARLEFDQRRTHIAEWLAKAKPTQGTVTVASEDVEAIVNAALSNFDAAVEKLRALRSGRQ